MIIIEAILMGVLATYFMDILAATLASRKIIYPFVSQETVGRWFLSIFQGKLIHKNINKSPELKNEKSWCLISHYLIGIGLAGVYLVLDLTVVLVQEHVWMLLAFGIATVCFPWFWLLSSIGIGVMASKSPDQSLILRTNLINHSNFGLGLFIWMLLFHRFFIQWTTPPQAA